MRLRRRGSGSSVHEGPPGQWRQWRRPRCCSHARAQSLKPGSGSTSQSCEHRFGLAAWGSRCRSGVKADSEPSLAGSTGDPWGIAYRFWFALACWTTLCRRFTVNRLRTAWRSRRACRDRRRRPRVRHGHSEPESRLRRVSREPRQHRQTREAGETVRRVATRGEEGRSTGREDWSVPPTPVLRPGRAGRSPPSHHPAIAGRCCPEGRRAARCRADVPSSQKVAAAARTLRPQRGPNLLHGVPSSLVANCIAKSAILGTPGGGSMARRAARSPAIAIAVTGSASSANDGLFSRCRSLAWRRSSRSRRRAAW